MLDGQVALTSAMRVARSAAARGDVTSARRLGRKAWIGAAPG